MLPLSFSLSHILNNTYQDAHLLPLSHAHAHTPSRSRSLLSQLLIHLPTHKRTFILRQIHPCSFSEKHANSLFPFLHHFFSFFSFYLHLSLFILYLTLSHSLTLFRTVTLSYTSTHTHTHTHTLEAARLIPPALSLSLPKTPQILSTSCLASSPLRE